LKLAACGSAAPLRSGKGPMV